MWVHPLDVLIFVVASAGTFLYGAKILVTVSSRLDARETPDLDVTCWAPAYFQDGHILYAHSTCASKFTKVLQGQDSEALGISAAIEDDPEVNATRPPVEEAPFRRARSVYGGDSGTEHSEGRQPEKLPVKHLYTTLALMCSLTLLTLAIAITYGRVAKSHACFLETAWRNAINNANTAQRRDATSGDKGALLEKNNHILGTRLEELWSANNLAVGYLVFQVVVLLAWLLMSMSCYHGSTQVGEHQSRMSTVPQMYQSRGQLDREAPASSQSGKAEDAGVSQSDGVSRLRSTDQGGHIEMVMTPASHDSGTFLCDFSISARVHASFYTYTIQCNYDVRRPAGPVGAVDIETQWGMIFTGGTTLSLLLAALILVHLLSFFVLSPLSRQRGLLLVLERLDIKPKVTGVKFGFTDLSFVSSFSTLDNRQPYAVPDAPEHPRDKHSINHRSHLDMV